jgi:hypothetical protein
VKFDIGDFHENLSPGKQLQHDLKYHTFIHVRIYFKLVSLLSDFCVKTYVEVAFGLIGSSCIIYCDIKTC